MIESGKGFWKLPGPGRFRWGTQPWQWCQWSNAADTLFVATRRGGFHGVVTMYHEQGQIAMKLLGFDRGVTVAGGLAAIIATPAHGTVFDIVGKNVSFLGAMRGAFRLACETATVR